MADHFARWADDLAIEGGLDAVDAIIKSCVNGARPSLDFPEVPHLRLRRKSPGPTHTQTNKQTPSPMSRTTRNVR